MKENVYLTEKFLGDFLVKYFPKGIWLHDKTFLNRKRPDYRNDFYKLIVEFDGYQHYTSAKRILDDKKKDDDAIKAGYKVIRIPYFVQLSTDSIFELFSLKIENYVQTYPHGFIDPKAILPADFCELGLKKFKSDLVKFETCEISKQIIKSLIDKHYDSTEYVYPKSIERVLMKYI